MVQPTCSATKLRTEEASEADAPVASVALAAASTMEAGNETENLCGSENVNEESHMLTAPE